MALSLDVETKAPASAEGRQHTLWNAYRSALDRFATLQDGLVARSLVRGDAEWTLTESSPLNTAEVVRALFLIEAHGLKHSWDSRTLLRCLVANPACRIEVQVAALTLWAAATGDDRLADTAFAALRGGMADGCSQSMTLGWALCALSEYAQMEGRRDDAQRLAGDLITRLTANQNPRSGLFHPSGRREGFLRRRVSDTTLSSQTYAILGLATFAIVFDDTSCLLRAERCASAICARQGPHGQWWWRYDASSGHVASRYPVYCVNQDSAVPAALRALQRAHGDSRYEDAIVRGIEWEFRAGEVGRALIDADSGVVARAVEEGSDGFVVNHELYSYQPARFICGVLNQRATAVPR